MEVWLVCGGKKFKGYRDLGGTGKCKSALKLEDKTIMFIFSELSTEGMNKVEIL